KIYFFFQAEDGIRDFHVTGVQTCALPISKGLVKGAGGYIKGMGSLYKKLGTGSFKLAGFALPKMATLTGWVGKKLTETKTNAKRLREDLLTKLETNKLKAKEYFEDRKSTRLN